MSPEYRPDPNNTLDIDYRLEAESFCPIDPGIIDVHTHIRGERATSVYEQVAREYGVTLTYTMTPVDEMQPVREQLGDRVRLIAFPDFLDVINGGHTKTSDWLHEVDRFHDAGARMIKFWAGPRGAEFEQGPEEQGRFALRAPHRIEAARHAAELGMCTMVHVGDPDFWFDKRYTDPAVYGTKEDQYKPLEEYLAEYPAPCIAAHMGGWPEDLEFLDALLSRHQNLYLDTSATKWMIRELSRHSDETLLKFLNDWQGRILFGSDIVVSDEMAASRSEDELYNLMASRYWALRTMWETDYSGPSPIKDPDTHTPDEPVHLQGRNLPSDLLHSLYHDTAYNLLEDLYNPTGNSDAVDSVSVRDPGRVSSD